MSIHAFGGLAVDEQRVEVVGEIVAPVEAITQHERLARPFGEKFWNVRSFGLLVVVEEELRVGGLGSRVWCGRMRPRPGGGRPAGERDNQ